jgi:hypothetical protein
MGGRNRLNSVTVLHGRKACILATQVLQWVALLGEELLDRVGGLLRAAPPPTRVRLGVVNREEGICLGDPLL